ncbi:MAG TPA: nickel pincer cofactor biosynthesis protein LarB [Victivallales bacterium]|nr:nickel pincer cofactor biosynthesis protein LarB [Victivallales bacterium]
MKDDLLIDILGKLKTDEINIAEALSKIKSFSNDNIVSDQINLDYSRKNRCGFPEFIYGAGKTPEQLISIINNIYEREEDVLVTRLDENLYSKISDNIPSLTYDPLAKILFYLSPKKEKLLKISEKKVAVLTAGTSDVSVGLEAKYTIEICGYKVNTFFDTGVAGIHRLFSKIEEIRNSDVVIVAAGMEGALPSVVAGLVAVPIIAVPTSIGYGASMNGLTAMFAMLNSCANGVLVVNIDNGFGAACAAVRILNSAKK